MLGRIPSSRLGKDVIAEMMGEILARRATRQSDRESICADQEPHCAAGRAPSGSRASAGARPEADAAAWNVMTEGRRFPAERTVKKSQQWQ